MSEANLGTLSSLSSDSSKLHKPLYGTWRATRALFAIGLCDGSFVVARDLLQSEKMQEYKCRRPCLASSLQNSTYGP
jgi:hypothetical protein